MTLKILDVPQGSEEWEKARLGMVTASEIGTIITPGTIKPANNMQSRAYAAQIAAERINGWDDTGYISADMERGWDDEPRAINAYTAYRDVAVTVTGFMVRDDWGHKLGYSPDGLVDHDGLLEIKSRAPKKHIQTILADDVPTENYAQCQAALLVSGRDWLDYISYCGGMRLYIKRVVPDPKWHAAIVDALDAFEDAVEGMTATYYNRVGQFPLTERVDQSRVELKLA